MHISPFSGCFCVLGCRLVCIAIVGCFLPVSGFVASSAVTCYYMHVWRARRNNARMKSALFSFHPSFPFRLSPFALLSAFPLPALPSRLFPSLSLRPPLLHCGCGCGCGCGSRWACAARCSAVCFFFLFIFLFYRSIIISDDIIFIII